MADEPKTRGHRIALSLSAGLLSLVLLAVLDFGAAQVCKSQCDFLFHLEHKKKYRIKHAVYHHDLAPRVSVMGRWGNAYYPVHTDSLGFKDAATRDVPLETEGYRILFIGDSFTEGVGVPYPETFVGRVGAALEDEGVTVLNAAVSSYAPAVYYAKVRHLLETVGLEFDHVMVFIDMSDIYDEANWYVLGDDGIVHVRNPQEEQRLRRAFDKGWQAWLQDNSLLVAFGYRLRDWAVYRRRLAHAAENDGNPAEPATDVALWEERVGTTRETQWCFDAEARKTWGERGLDVARADMDRLHALLSERGIKLTVWVYPWPASIIRKPPLACQDDVWREWGRSRGVDVIDLFPVFAGGGDPWKTLREDFIPYDVHWNAAGHARVAAAVLDYLKKAGLKKAGVPPTR